jgi:serine protease Do
MLHRLVALLVLVLVPSAGAQGVEGTSVIADVVERVSPMVATITAKRTVAVPAALSVFFFEGRRQISGESQGAGVIVDPSGLVMTNEHVVAGAESIAVTLADGRRYRGRVRGSDRARDIAILELDPRPRIRPSQVAKMGDSSRLRLGEWVVVLGNPYALERTLTKGVVSGLNRNFTVEDRSYTGMIQTDATINPGDSGGPMFNLRGEVVGLATAIHSRASGIAFAIPVNTAWRAARALMSAPRQPVRAVASSRRLSRG